MGNLFSVNVRSNGNVVAMELMAAAQEMRDLALVRALNKTADQVKVAASREVRAAGYNLKASTIKDNIQVRRAGPGNLKATVVARGRPVPMIEYSARKTAKGITVNVLKGRKLLAGAFFATMPNGHKGVFVRDMSKPRKERTKKNKWHDLPIKELFGPSVPSGLANATVQAALQRLIADRFPQILKSESAWLQRRAGR